MRLKTNKGFTLIELLVVVAIIGLLATMVAVSLTSARSRARDSRRVSDIRQIENALELYFAAYQQYPTNWNILLQGQQGYLNLNSIPVDPSGISYCYAYGTEVSSGKNLFYHIGAKLENANSDFLNQDLDYNSSSTSQVTWTGSAANSPGVSACGGNNGGPNGFNGSDTNGPYYDRGVLP